MYVLSNLLENELLEHSDSTCILFEVLPLPHIVLFFFFLSLNIIELYNQKEHLDAVTSSSCFVSLAYIQFGP